MLTLTVVLSVEGSSQESKTGSCRRFGLVKDMYAVKEFCLGRRFKLEKRCNCEQHRG